MTRAHGTPAPRYAQLRISARPARSYRDVVRPARAGTDSITRTEGDNDVSRRNTAHLGRVPRGALHGRRLRPALRPRRPVDDDGRSEEHTSELQSRQYLVCRLLLEKKNTETNAPHILHSTVVRRIC